jgi:hypothetical protein
MSGTYYIDSRVLNAMNNAIQNLAEELLMDCGREYGFSGKEAIDKLSVKNISMNLKRFQECNEKSGIQVQLCTFEEPITMTEKQVKKRGRPKKDPNAEQPSKKMDGNTGNKSNDKKNDKEGDVTVKKRGRPRKEKKIIVSEEQKYEDDVINEVEYDIFGSLIKG